MAALRVVIYMFCLTAGPWKGFQTRITGLQKATICDWCELYIPLRRFKHKLDLYSQLFSTKITFEEILSTTTSLR